MKKILGLLLVLSLLTNAALVYFFVFKGSTKVIKDQRTSIKISAQNKEFVLAEMRGFLESIQAINEGILSNNPQKIIAAGSKSGGGLIHDAPQGLMKTLPIGFKTLGLDTHAKFDAIAKMAQDNYKREEAQKQVTEILSNCTACHRSFKLTAQP